MGNSNVDEFALFLKSEQMQAVELNFSKCSTIGVGGVMILLIVLFGFRNQLWPLVKSKLHMNSLGAIIGWGVLFAVLLSIEKIVPLLPDLRTICIAGLTGTGIGQVSDTVAGFLSKKNNVPGGELSDQNEPVSY